MSIADRGMKLYRDPFFNKEQSAHLLFGAQGLHASVGFKAQKNPSHAEVFGGPVRIRTAVAAFAELSLATRPQDLFFSIFVQMAPF
jgi:hypothetical protein